ncbi:hypothetical protein ABZ490_40160 [Streptomyces sp. NPDC005811]|uniref:hypothetical protein n=1 Tax=Streptomyces sp. NPDC005811 TaxID=3154565 RepID=UPI0034110052
MISRAGYGTPRLVASAAVRGPAVRAVVRVQLRASHGFVDPPSPTQQYGGIERLPAGTVARLDIGNARHCSSWIASLVAGALRDCAEVEVVGTDPRGVAETRNALTRALNTRISPAC